MPGRNPRLPGPVGLSRSARRARGSRRRAPDGRHEAPPPRPPRCRRRGWPGRARSSGRLSTRQCGVRVAAHSAARSTWWGVPKSRSNESAYAGTALLERREDRPAVVVGHHDREVGARLVGSDHQAVAVVQEGDVAEQRECPRGRGPPESRSDRRGDRPVDAGQAPVADHQPPVADPVPRHHQVEVAHRVRGADEEQPARREGAGDRTGHLLRGQPTLLRRAARRGPARAARRRRATRRASRRPAPRPPRTGPSKTRETRRPGSV